MKKSTLSLAIGLLLACSTGMAKTQHLTLEQRMALLEERLEASHAQAAHDQHAAGQQGDAHLGKQRGRLNSFRHNKPPRSAKLKPHRATRR